ncbi:MAG: hypothetical protein GTO24_01425 [candidate division Zixibacteria bacterium]|nr:hypothetical protein [candidate division Zixibacteria bacterium]
MRSKVLFPMAVVSTIALLSVAIVVWMVGCSDKVTKEGENVVTTTSLFLFAPSSVLKDEAVPVNVGMTDQDGNRISAVEVSFSVTPDTLGFFTPSIDTTDANGLVSTVFTGTELGVGTIVAVAEVAQDNAQIKVVAYTSKRPDGPIQ